MALDGKNRQFVHGDWQATDGYSIAWQESLGGTFDGDTGEDVIVYDTNWANCKDFIDGLLGFAEVKSDGSISRELPQRHPYFPSLWCMHASYKAFPTLDKEEAPSYVKTNSYGTFHVPEAVRITAVFRPPPYRLKRDEDTEFEYQRFVERESEFQVDFVSGGTQKLKSVLNNSYMSDTAPPARVPTLQKTLVWHDIPTAYDDPYYPDNWDAIQFCVGKVNDKEFDGHPAGTVLLLSAKPIQKQPNSLNNRWLFAIRYVFMVRDIKDTIGGVPYGGINYWNGTHGTTGAISVEQDPDVEKDWVGWNSFYMPKSTNYPPIFTYFTTDGTAGGEPYYKPADFDSLFSLADD